MADKIRWGIMSTGRIAGVFADGLRNLPDAELVAVGSRSQETADAFGEKHQVPHRHASYEALANDPDVDLIYIATPHPLHAENSLMCLAAGKGVLCEKPFTMNGKEAEKVIAAARHYNKPLLEGMWTRFLPVMESIRAVLAAGTIGEVKMVSADFGFRGNFDPQNRYFNPALGGGSLLDIGVYSVSFASMILGTPTRIQSMAHLGSTGVDEQSSIQFGYAGDQMAALTTSIKTWTPLQAMIAGEKGYIHVAPRWYRSERFTIWRLGEPEEVYQTPIAGNGYHYEAAALMQMLREGQIESQIMPHAETLSVMQTLDAIRAQWGLKYPMEQ
jgi:predicted dehydrogenase